ncbi:MAG: hypothetical protein KatS3mg068_1336 [Candidatus Sericytochromatia bacterium]|nr:MAG: hypothetical protein KatS3mg068_1336 [Candidatus Sericytochromatia bacterium]
MLLKASQIKFLETSDSSFNSEEIDFIEKYNEEEIEIEYSEEIILGDKIEKEYESDNEINFKDEAAEEEEEEDLIYDEEHDIYIGKPILIGGSTLSKKEEDYLLQTEEEIQTEYEDIESLIADEINQEEIEEVEEKKLSEGEALVDDFSTAFNLLESSFSAVQSWRDTKITRNTQLPSFIDNYRDIELDFSQKEFLTQEQRDELLASATQLISQAPDFNSMNKIIEKLEENIKTLIEQNSYFYEELINKEKEDLLNEVEEHIQSVLNKQRELINKDAEEHIQKTIEFYKNKMNEDKHLINAANNIISRKEQILDEAYSRSLKLIEEAEEQAERIIQEAQTTNQEAERIKKQAKIDGENLLNEYKNQAEQIISEANMEAARIIQAAEEQHQQIVEAATQDGFNIGYQEGREEAIKENAQLLMDTTNSLNQLHNAFPTAVKDNEGKLIKLTIKLADMLIKEEIMARPEICIKTLDRAIRRVSDLERVLIKVNPLDLDLILPKEGYFRGILPDVQEFIITGHYAVPRGGCIIETNSGTVDGQFHTQLAIVEEIFNGIKDQYDENEEEVSEENSKE